MQATLVTPEEIYPLQILPYLLYILVIIALIGAFFLLKHYIDVKNHKLKQLVQAQDTYIDLLGQELNSLSIFAHTHGWRSNLVREGEIQREKIQKIRDSL
jgi:hypothetical protein